MGTKRRRREFIANASLAAGALQASTSEGDPTDYAGSSVQDHFARGVLSPQRRGQGKTPSPERGEVAAAVTIHSWSGAQGACHERRRDAFEHQTVRR